MIHAMLFILFAGMVLYGMAGMGVEHNDKYRAAIKDAAKSKDDIVAIKDALLKGGVCLCDVEEHREGARFCHICGGFALKEK